MGPTVFAMLGIFLAMQSLVKKKGKKKIDRNQIKPVGTEKGGIFLKNVQVGKGFVVQLKRNTFQYFSVKSKAVDTYSITCLFDP